MSLFNYGKLSSFGKSEPLIIPEKSKNNSLSKENPDKITHTDFAPKRFGLKYDPPTISNAFLCTIDYFIMINE